MRSCARRPTGLSTKAVTIAVSIPKQRFRPRATLYSPPPSQTSKRRVVWIRPSPGSRRSMTSPSATRSKRQSDLSLTLSSSAISGEIPLSKPPYFSPGRRSAALQDAQADFEAGRAPGGRRRGELVAALFLGAGLDRAGRARRLHLGPAHVDLQALRLHEDDVEGRLARLSVAMAAGLGFERRVGLQVPFDGLRLQQRDLVRDDEPRGAVPGERARGRLQRRLVRIGGAEVGDDADARARQ